MYSSILNKSLTYNLDKTLKRTETDTFINLEEFFYSSEDTKKIQKKKSILLNRFNAFKYFNIFTDTIITSQLFRRIKEKFNSNIKDNIKQYRIAIHIEKENLNLEIYKKLILKFRLLYPNKEIHIFSEGFRDDFKRLDDNKLIYHLNYNKIRVFIELLNSEYLVISNSNLSYLAGLLSDNIIYSLDNINKLPKKWIKIFEENITMKNNKIVEAYNDMHLGDCIFRVLSFCKIKEYLEFNNIQIKFYCREEYLYQLNEFINSSNITLEIFTVPKGLNTWIACQEYENYWLNGFSEKIRKNEMNFDEYYIKHSNEVFSKLSLDTCIDTFWYTDLDLLTRYDRLPSEFKELDYLILNNYPQSGQYDYVNNKDFWDNNIRNLSKKYKIATIFKVDNILCTLDKMLTIKDIGAISTRVKNIIAIDSAPMIGCLNNYTMSNVEKFIVYSDYIYYEKTKRGTNKTIW